MAETFKIIQLRGKGEVRWASINRPQDRNSFNSALMTEVMELLQACEAEETTRVVVFTGAGEEHFIGGADGIEMMQLEPAAAQKFSARFQALLRRMERSPLILVAAINGLCFGGGFEFAMACDLRVALPSARIGLPEVKVGLIPGGGGTQRLPRLIGQGLAMEMILSGKLFPGAEAAEIGLVNRVAGPGALADGVDKLLAPILRQPAYATSLAKRAVKASDKDLDAGQAVEAELFSHCHEHNFFHDLMVAQLESGVLKTTEDKTKLMKERS